MRCVLIAVAVVLAAVVPASSAGAGAIPSTTLGEIAGTLMARAYVPRSLPPGFLLTGWKTSPHSDGSDATLSFAKAGTAFTWVDETHLQSIDCQLPDAYAQKQQFGTLVVHGVGTGPGRTSNLAWACIGRGTQQFEIYALSKKVTESALMKIVGNAKLAPQLPVPQISVVKSGFQMESGLLTYELELHNASTTVDAIGVTVKTTFVDNLGRSVASDSIELTGIPAGGTVYAVGSTASNVSLNPTGLQPAITIERTQPKGLTVPSVANVQVSDGTFSDSAEGSFMNPYTAALPTYATVYGVYLDSNGNFIGGDAEAAGASVEPHATVSFSFDFVPTGTSSVAVSVDPCGGEIDFGSCPALPT